MLPIKVITFSPGDCGKYEGCDEITQGMIVAAIINGMPKIQARVKYEGKNQSEASILVN